MSNEKTINSAISSKSLFSNEMPRKRPQEAVSLIKPCKSLVCKSTSTKIRRVYIIHSQKQSNLTFRLPLFVNKQAD